MACCETSPHFTATALFLAQEVANATAIALSTPRPEGATELRVIVELSRDVANQLGCEPRLTFPVRAPLPEGPGDVR